MLTGRPLNKPYRALVATGSLLEFLTAGYASVTKGGRPPMPECWRARVLALASDWTPLTRGALRIELLVLLFDLLRLGILG
jgi:hypothetical protein